MKLLFIAKRHPQQRDLIERPYGRFHFLPTALAALGHEVRVILCSHRRLPSLGLERDGVRWSSHDALTLGLRGFLTSLARETRAFAPDWVVGCSDAWYGPLARRLARQSHAWLAVDAYDNYEAYMPWNLPLHWQWRRSIAAADVVTAAGPQLAARLDSHRPGRSPTAIVPMAADPIFVRHDRGAARAALGLPAEAPLVGYSGGWAGNRGTQILVDAFRRVRARRPDVRLVLTGRPPEDVAAEPGVLALGYLPDAQLPLVLSALDVACVITADTAFGRYSYPAKLCEALACGVPVVATATAPVRWMLQDDACFLAPVGDACAIAERFLAQLSSPCRDYGPLPDWNASARALQDVLASAATARSS